jgi:transcriptional regulator with XRE-family HTH domain
MSLELKDLLKRARTAKKLTQQQIADLMKIHRQNYNRLETGKVDMTHTMISRFCDAVGISISEFYAEQSEENEYQIKVKNLQVKDRKEVYQLIDSKLSK